MLESLGYHASHEQFPPSELLAYAKLAEAAGFDAASCSDHFHPWSERQGHSGFAFAWLGAALEATRLRMGVVNAPGQRYHPAIVAQAAATLAEMYPGRFWLAVGSGENLNEHVTGEPWPDKPTRNARLRESVDVMRALWAGRTVDHDGLVRVRKARLYTCPEAPPRLLCAALSEETARWAGAWADGLLTAASSEDELRGRIDAFREGGGEGKPLVLQMKVSYAPTDGEARSEAHAQWRTNVVAPRLLADLETPQDFEAAAKDVTMDELEASVCMSSDIARHVARIEAYAALGFSEIYVHHVGRDQRRFLRALAEYGLPARARRPI